MLDWSQNRSGFYGKEKKSLPMQGIEPYSAYRIQSLYRLSYPGSCEELEVENIINDFNKLLWRRLTQNTVITS
jgi:hypothetical protein